MIPIVDNNENSKEYHRNLDEIDVDDRYRNKNMQNPDKERGGKNKGRNQKNNNESLNNKNDEDDSENKKDNGNNEKTEGITTIENTTSGGTPTLNEFLSKLNCTGCGKRCLLTNPQCNIGMSYRAEKVQEYNQLYGSNESSNSQEYDENVNEIPNLNEFDKKEKDNNINDITKANINGTSIIDYISIMGLLIGGTYYIIDISDRRKTK